MKAKNSVLYDRKWPLLVLSVVFILVCSVTAFAKLHSRSVFGEGVITFTGTVTNSVNACGTDGYCLFTANGLRVITDCGFGPGGADCPLKVTQNPQLGDLVRVTTQKDLDDSDYNLHCEKCGVTILKSSSGD